MIIELGFQGDACLIHPYHFLKNPGPHHIYLRRCIEDPEVLKLHGIQMQVLQTHIVSIPVGKINNMLPGIVQKKSAKSVGS